MSACGPRTAIRETVAGDSADALLGLAGVASVRVAVRKPHVMLEGPLEYAEIVVERQND